MEGAQEQTRERGPRLDPKVFWPSIVVVTLFVAWGMFFTENLATVAGAAFGFITTYFSWVYVLATIGFVVFALWLAFGRYGKVRLGGEHERPEFRTISWVAMMFSAGMGIGLMFWGASEPIAYLSDPPHGAAQAGTQEAAVLAQQYAFFHWALHPWAIYAVFGLALAYFTFRRGRANLVSEIFRPLIGDKVDGPIGKAIDVLAIFATVFGSATSLGLGALQINAGLNFVWGVPSTTTIAVIIIAVITVLFIISAVTGVHRGIEWLSNTNMVLAVLLLIFLFIAGPTVYILNSLSGATGAYVSNFVGMSFRTGFNGDQEFLSSWTVFYWAWWISWAPFVGTFIARISRGRTIREYVLGVLIAPSVVSFVWFAIMGGTALNLQLTGAADIVGAYTNNGEEIGLFATLEPLPLTAIVSVLVMILVALFFISGADAASVVMGMLSSRGDIEPKASVIVIWGTLTGAATAILLLIGGEDSLSGLQTAAIVSSAPFLVILICMCFSLMKSLRSERLPSIQPVPGRDTPAPAPGQAYPEATNGAPEPGRAAGRPQEAPAPQRMSTETEGLSRTRTDVDDRRGRG